MKKTEKRALLDLISRLENQKSYLESIYPNPSHLQDDLCDLANSSEFILGEINALRACLSFLNYYFCSDGK